MRSRALIFVVVLGVIAVAAGWVYESQLRSRIETAEFTVPDSIDYFLTNLDYRAVDTNGDLDYEFSSRRLEHYPRNDVSLIEVPVLNIYRSSARWQVNALQGELQHKDNLLWLRDQVVMQKSGNDPFEVLTDSIRFEPERDLVSSEQAVLMRSNQARIEAEAAVFDLAARVYRLTRTRAIYYHGDS